MLEGLGAALVLPALAALIAGNYEGKDRITAYAIIGGVAGAGIAVGPIVGGWATTVLTWRIVFVGEVILVLIILALVRFVIGRPRATGRQAEARRGRRHPLRRPDSASSSSPSCSRARWGFVLPGRPAVRPSSASARAVFLIGVRCRSCSTASCAGAVGAKSRGEDPLFRLELLQHPDAARWPGQPALAEPRAHGHLLRASRSISSSCWASTPSRPVSACCRCR